MEFYNKSSPEQKEVEILRNYFQLKLSSGSYKASTVKLEHCALKFLFTKVLHKKWPQKHLPLPKVPVTYPTVLSQIEVVEIINTLKSLKNRTIIMFLYSTGARISECTKIKISDLDISRMQVNIQEGKGRKQRFIPLSPLMLLTLYRYIDVYKPEIYLFEKLNCAGSQMRPVNIQAICIISRKQTKSIYKKYTPHTFRHSFATHLLEQGTNIIFIQKMMGHSSILATLKYVHIQQLTAEQVQNPLDRLQGLVGVCRNL
jgi:integrase/recombinase XerD